MSNRTGCLLRTAPAWRDLRSLRCLENPVGSWAATTTITTTPPTLSSLAIAGQATGNGSASIPAVTTTGKSLSLSTEFLSRSGSAKADVDLTYAVTPAVSGGSLTGLSATVNGKSLTATAIGKNGEAFLVPTDAQGKATLTLTDANAASLSVAVSAPYTDVTLPAAADVQWTSGQ